MIYVTCGEVRAAPEGMASSDGSSRPFMPDFFVQLQAEMVRALPVRSLREKKAFATLSLDEQTWRFMNWQSRLVHPHPRQVNKAVGFDCLPEVRANRQRVDALLGRIARGDDLSPHLSKRVCEGYRLRPPGRKDGPDFDLLLNEWGIHHLHIHPAPASSKELLYAIFGRGVAFALAIAPHGVWTSRQFIASALQSWPNQGLFVPLNVAPGQDPSANDHEALRKAGMTIPVTHGDRVWLSGVTLGLTTALVSTRVSMEASRVLRCLRQATEAPDHLASQLMAVAALNHKSWPAQQVIGIRWLSGPDRYCFAFVEETSGATLLI
ncbi:MAG: hypothetical protein J0I21_11720 [Alphaproteobacteria bacterium]|nr:hypothetical protein [Alphaproteobacteria bacterium]